MQLGDTAGQRAHEREIAGVKLRRGWWHRVADRRLLEEMPEIILGVIPAVALVLDICLQQRKRVTSVGADVFERAGDRNDAGEMRDVGQEAADCRLRIE